MNIEKCFSVHFGNRSYVPNYSYTINSEIISSEHQFSDLGLRVQIPLSFNGHIDAIVSKAFYKLGLIKKVFKFRTMRSTVKLYKAYVRPMLEYASITWNPYTQSSIDNVERVQRRMCQLIPELRHLTYRQQLNHIGLLSLKARRLRFQLISLYKMYKGITDIEFNSIFNFRPLRQTRSHDCSILPKFSRYNYRLNFFSVSIIPYWNLLSQDDVEAPSVDCFKGKLVAFFRKIDVW